MNVERAKVYWVNLDTTQGREIKKTRPCLVVGINPLNEARSTVVVIPISSSAVARPPLTIPVASLKKPSVVIIDQIRAIDKSRIVSYIGQVSQEEMYAVEDGLRVVLGLE